MDTTTAPTGLLLPEHPLPEPRWFPGIVHWWLAAPGPGFCDEYVCGDTVLGDPGDDRSLVTCPDCLEWIHA